MIAETERKGFDLDPRLALTFIVREISVRRVDDRQESRSNVQKEEKIPKLESTARRMSMCHGEHR